MAIGCAKCLPSYKIEGAKGKKQKTAMSSKIMNLRAEPAVPYGRVAASVV
jgi:hypothetical protein